MAQAYVNLFQNGFNDDDDVLNMKAYDKVMNEESYSDDDEIIRAYDEVMNKDVLMEEFVNKGLIDLPLNKTIENVDSLKCDETWPGLVEVYEMMVF